MKLYDSYALGLNFYPKAELRNNKFNLDEIKEYGLNPSNCLVLSQANNSPLLGQTILITAKITGKNKNKSSEWLKNNIADQYIKALFPENEGNILESLLLIEPVNYLVNQFLNMVFLDN